MAKFIVVVLDGFGIGEMPDVPRVRPQDQGANTAAKLIEFFPERRLPTLEKLGLLNTLPKLNSVMKPSKEANWGRALLAHEGCDTFMGHQELMGTKPVPPLVMPFNDSILTIESALKKKGFDIERRYRDELALLQVNGAVIIGDNLEADLGQVYNLTANFSHIDFEDVKKIAETVRQSNKVSRNIAFGGFINDMEQIYSAIEVKTDLAGRPKYIGVNAPKSGVYENGFQVVHLGYGVDYKTQVPHQLTARDIPTYLYGKVADIVQNPHGTSYKSVVDTEKVFSLLLKDLSISATGFYCANIQETDLAGHQQDADRYWKILEKADKGLADIITLMSEDDVLVVMADHGNDPFIGHSKHTREMVPVLVHQPRLKGKEFNTLNTLADIGASAAAYFMAPRPQFGEVFALPLLKVVREGGPTPRNFVHQGEIQ